MRDSNNKQIFQYAKSFQGLPLVSKCFDYNPPSTRCVMDNPTGPSAYAYMSVVSEVPWGYAPATTPTVPKMRAPNDYTQAQAFINRSGFCGQLNVVPSLSNFAPAFFPAVYEDSSSKPTDRTQDFADPSSANREELSTQNLYDTAVFCSKVTIVWFFFAFSRFNTSALTSKTWW